MTVISAQKVAAFVFDTLAADATFSAAVGGRIYRDMVPAASSLPAAIVGPIVAAPDSNTLSGRRVLSTVVIDVHLVAAGASYSPINAAAERADTLLQELRGTSGGVLVVKLTRDEPRMYLETESGASYAHLVQTYRTPAYALP